MIDPGPGVATASLRGFAARLRPRLELADAGFPDGTFDALALELFRLQFDANPIYRRWCESAGRTPDKVTRWAAIPAVPTVAFKELEFTSLAPAERTAVFHSSGTTGQTPSRHFHGVDSLALYEASLLAGFARQAKAAGVGRRRFLSLTPPAVAVPHSSLAHMFDVCSRRLGAPDSAFFGHPGKDGAWDLDLPRLVAELEASQQARQPVFLLGTAFHFVHFIDYCSARNVRFDFGQESAVLETGGYKGRSREMAREELHAAITRTVGIPTGAIVREYGMSELSSQAYAPDSAGTADPGEPAAVFRFPPWARAVLVSPETGREVAEGEIGLVRIFDLANVWSVQAVQTEDLAIRRGTGFELLGRAPSSEPRGCSLMAPA